MRLSIAASVALLLAACAHPREPAAVPSNTAATRHINPVNIRRAGRELPPGYEVTAVSGVAAPSASWGLGGDGAANPARCAALADPAGGHGESAQGISGSGTGGIVYAVVAAVPTGPVALDGSLVAGCRQWSMTSRRARARRSPHRCASHRRRPNPRHGDRHHHVCRRRQRNRFPGKHLHRLSGQLLCVHHGGQRPRLTGSGADAAVRGRVAGEIGGGVTWLTTVR